MTDSVTQIIRPDNGARSSLDAQAPTQNAVVGFDDAAGFALAQRVATAFAKSSLVPTQYQNNLPNCLVALNMAKRMGADPLMVMQNLYIVHGRPAWSAQFLISTFNACGRFASIRYEWKGEKGSDAWGCRAYTVEIDTGERIEGPWVTFAMVKDEGWLGKKGSKWQTMPELMFHYRSAAFLVRTVAPELAMGLHTAEEIRDVMEAETVERPAGVRATRVEATRVDDLQNAVPADEAPAELAPDDEPIEDDADAVSVAEILDATEPDDDEEV